MKKRILITCLLLAAISACEKQPESGQSEEPQLSNMLVFSGTKPEETSVKTYYDAASKSILWSPPVKKYASSLPTSLNLHRMDTLLCI